MYHLSLRISQFLGYFPHSLDKDNFTCNKSKWKRFVYFLHFLLISGNIFLFVIYTKILHPQTNLMTLAGRQSEANRLYSTVVMTLKAFCHIFATSYVKLAIFLKREDLTKFWEDFQEIIKLSDQLGFYPGQKSVGKIGKDFIAWIVLCVLFIADMWQGYLLNPNRGDGAASK